MRRFEYLQPANADEAVALLARHGGRASVLAGGTDLLVEIKEHVRAPDYVVDIKKIRGIANLESNPDGLTICALTTARDVEQSQQIHRNYAGLWQAVRELGSIQIRNRATVVGNVCRASPSADTLAPLIADGASLLILGANGQRIVNMEAFFTGPGRTVLRPDEIVTGIKVPPPQPGTGKCYIKHGRRKAMELATVGVAVTLTMADGVCRDIRIVLGAVAPTPIRVANAEAALRGKRIDVSSIGDAARLAMQVATPISNVRASADYRKRMVEELTRRAIVQALEAIR